MHIAFLTPEYPHPNFSRSGGLGTSIKNLAKGLVAQEIEVTVFIMSQTQNADFFKDGIRLISIAKKKHFAFNWYLQRKRVQKIVQHYINNSGIQLLEAPDWMGISAFMDFNVPLIIRLNGSDGYFCYLEERPQKRKHRFLEQIALKNADALVSVSNFTGLITKQIFNLNKSITTIHNSINTEDFKPLNLKVNDDQLLYYGTIIRKKGVLELAHVFNQVVAKKPNATLLLLGKDVIDIFEHRSTMELFNSVLSSEAKVNVKHISEVPYQKVCRFIAESKVILLPSFAEAFPMTWLETLAMEKPLVCSNIGWSKELVIDGVTGYTVVPKDHTLFAEKILKLLDDNSLCTTLGKAGRLDVIKRFSTEVITKQNIKFYQSLINE